jgi:DNA-binding transcriptional LysR family regulator
MNLRKIDLNLLVIFDALMSEPSVGAAALKVGISPSAMSHALRRLRQTLNDEIIRRTPRGMVPTRRARQLAQRTRGILKDVGRALSEQLHFDPKTSERSFRIRLSDYVVGCLMPRLCVRLHSEAPGITLSLDHLPVPGGFESEDFGDLQIRVCSEPPKSADERQKRLLLDRFLIAMRRDHPAAKRKMTLKAFLELPQVRGSTAITGANVVDPKLARHGVHRRIAVTVPSLPEVIPIILNSDLCAVLPEQWIAFYTDPAKLSVHPLPSVASVPFTVDMVWYSGDEREAGHRWLRETIESEFRQMHEDSSLQWSERHRKDLQLHLGVP